MKLFKGSSLLVVLVCITAILTYAFVLNDNSSEKADQPKVKWLRTSMVFDGQMEGATKFAKNVTEYVNKNYKDVNVQVYKEVIGTGGKIYWLVDFKSQQHFLEVSQKLDMDLDFMDIVATAEFYIDTPVDKLLQSLY
ncbi:DUF6039 family protein [candidate division KSB1 bacterium]